MYQFIKSKSASSKNFSYLHFGLLLIGMPAWVLLNESMPKSQKVIFISNATGVDTTKMHVVTNFDELESGFAYEFNQHNSEEAFIKENTISTRIRAGGLHGYALDLKIVNERFSTKLIEFSCVSMRKFRIIRQRLELMPYEMKHGERLKGNYYCTARYYDEDVHQDSVVIEGYFDLELFQL